MTSTTGGTTESTAATLLKARFNNMDKAKQRSAYAVTYNSQNHFSVLTQMHGSKWPAVLPYCLANVGLMVMLIVLKRHVLPPDFNLQVSSEGHTFLTFVVSYLLVSRVTTSLGNYNTARAALGVMYREARELIQCSCVLTVKQKDATTREWRQQLAYRVCLLLRTTMAVVNYPDDQIPAWTVPELNNEELEDVMRAVFVSNDFKRWAHYSDRTEFEESMRVPLRLAYQCRKTIHSHWHMLSEPLPVSQENNLLGSVDTFMKGYYDLRTFLTTPTPFPLVQMTRTFMFLYVYATPFVFLSDPSSDFAHCFTVFMLTYGMVGMEEISMELDDPFGNDANDFDNNAIARTAYEDTYLTIADIDGPEWAEKLRDRMRPQDSPSDVSVPYSAYDSVPDIADETTGLLASKRQKNGK